MITLVARRVLPLVTIASVVVACISRVRIDDPGSDMWFHLRLGQEFLSGWPISDPGHLGTFDSESWSPTQWLPQVAMASMQNAFGVAGVIWLAATAHILLVVVIYVVCRQEAAPLPAALATVLSFLALTFGLSPRPQVLSYLLVAVTVSAWLATGRDGRPRWWLVAIAWAWAPLHGMWPLASMIGVVCVAGIALDRKLGARQLATLGLIPLLSAVVPVLTPIGFDIYRSVLLVGGRREYFLEWGPTDFHQPYAAVLAIMLAIAVTYVARGQPSWLYILVLLMSAGWAIYSARTAPVAAVIAAPLVAHALQTIAPSERKRFRGERIAVASIALTGAAVMTFQASGRATEPVVPGWTNDRLAELSAGTPVLDDWATGPYYLWKHRDLDLVLHGSGDVFTDAEIERNNDIVSLKPGWKDELDALNVEAAILEADTPLGWALSHDESWKVIEKDDEFVFLVPRN